MKIRVLKKFSEPTAVEEAPPAVENPPEEIPYGVMNPALAKAVKVCQVKKTTLQVLYRFAVRRGTLHLTDLEETLIGACSAPDGLYTTNTFLQAGSLELAHNKGVSTDEFPCISEFKRKRKIDVKVFQNMDGFTSFVLEDFATRVCLTGICLTKNTLVATDGHKMLWQSLPDIEFDGEVIIPARAWKKVEQLKKISPLQAVEISDTEIWFHFRDFEYFSKFIEGPYPDYQRIMPTEFKKTVPLSNAANKVFAAALKKAGSLGYKFGRILIEGCFVFVRNSDTQIKAKVNCGGDYLCCATGFQAKIFALCLAQFPSSLVIKTNETSTGPVVFSDDQGKGAIAMPFRLDADDQADYTTDSMEVV